MLICLYKAGAILAPLNPLKSNLDNATKLFNFLIDGIFYNLLVFVNLKVILPICALYILYKEVTNALP